MADDASRPKVLIIGAGFAGLACARKLRGKPVDVDIVDRHNYHLFTPFLYQVATSLLNPSDIALPVRSVVRHDKNVSFHQHDIIELDLDNQVAKTLAGRDIKYDYVMIAGGMETNYFGNDEIKKVAYPLSKMPDAICLRNQIITCLESAAHETERDAIEHWLTFVVVGGGPTGVEFCGALAELIRLVVPKEYPELPMDAFRVLLVEGKDRLLSPFDPKISAYAEKKLTKCGVEPLLGHIVKTATADSVTLDSGETIKAKTLVWAAGVKPNSLAGSLDVSKSHSGRLEVNDKLQITGYEDKGAYAVGDNASFDWEGNELPAVATPAMQEARHVAYNIVQDVREGKAGPEPFKYWDKGEMAAVARWSCVAQLGRLKLTGLLGWVAWAFVHIYYLAGFRNRISVLCGWFWDYLHFDRPVRAQIEIAQDAWPHTLNQLQPDADWRAVDELAGEVSLDAMYDKTGADEPTTSGTGSAEESTGKG